MAVSEKDIKKLWGLAAGRCSFPGCEQECIAFLNEADPTILGEMAHVIAKKPDGPRGQPAGGQDTYENLVLMCPTHHRQIDKAPAGTYSVDTIQEWKRLHEERVRNAFQSPKFHDLYAWALAIKRLLIENKSTWSRYGPESSEAKRNPISNLADVWQLRKLDTIVPNNRRIAQLIEQNKELVDIGEYEVCMSFIQHAEGFEQSCYVRSEGVPRFPVEFEELINNYAAKK